MLRSLLPVAAAATLRGIMLFPGSERARELGRWRSTGELEDELDQALAVFRGVFGRSPGSIIAPDYTWDARIEDIWESRGLTVVQGKREQINPDWLPGRTGRAQPEQLLGAEHAQSIQRIDHRFHASTDS